MSRTLPGTGGVPASAWWQATCRPKCSCSTSAASWWQTWAQALLISSDGAPRCLNVNCSADAARFVKHFNKPASLLSLNHCKSFLIMIYFEGSHHVPTRLHGNVTMGRQCGRVSRPTAAEPSLHRAAEAFQWSQSMIAAACASAGTCTMLSTTCGALSCCCEEVYYAVRERYH